MAIQVPQVSEARIAGQKLHASVQPDGYLVEVYCWGWGRRPDGSVEIDFRGRLTSPADLLERMPIR